jgi:predicted DCC family thiol-disulfide oxidoreductase YuxK
MSGQDLKANRDVDSEILESLDDSHPLIVFDGVCVLCSGFARMVVRFDKEKRFRFATAQSPLGQALYRRHGLRTDFYDTNLVIIDGVAFTRMDSLLAVCDALGWPWRAARLIRLLPRRARDRLYAWTANNRYAWFGQKDSCEIPSRELRERIIG